MSLLAPSRPGALRRGGPCALMLLVLHASAVRAEESPLPAGTDPYVGVPPYLPNTLADLDVVATWCDACTNQGRAERGTRRGGDLLFAAADVCRAYLRDTAAAAALYPEAAAAYPPGDIGRSILLVRWLAVALDRRNAPQATRLLTDIDGLLDRAPPRDAEPAELGRWRVWDEERRFNLPRLRARHDEAAGRYREAAETLERLAQEEAQGLERAVRARILEQAARARYRAGMRPEAVRAMEAAIEIRAERGDDEAALATLRFWVLYAKHGLLDEQGRPLVTSDWPGEDFERDLRAYLRAIQGVEGVGARYLSLASKAYAAKRYETALEIYLLGLRDPSLVELARNDSSVWRGLLMGYSAAMELERFDEAERILEIVERVADEPIDDKDAYTLALAKARRWAAERPMREEARRKLAEAKRRRAKRDAESKDRPREPPRIETGETSGDDPWLADDVEDGTPSWLLPAVLAALGALLVILLWRRRA